MATTVLFSYIFDAVAFLPFDRNDQKCVHREADFVDAGYINLNFFVRYVEKIEESAMETAMKDIKGKKGAVLDQVFAKSKGDLCDRLKSVLESNGGDVDKFGGIVAVKCGYKFVWYQLAYEYSHAAASSLEVEAAWETGHGSYDAKCGQIFFFP
ncbi:hypothetical protein AAVH_18509 [Aphelenchoides avenae]|nr:hypothetical protein AAVH_42824 [Aphelenchus avenae]KAH7714114.1 hypothetical protein AAVH_18509 [Aphelenchus avenae]